MAKQYQGQVLSLSDLINEGNIGLIKAAEHFDSSKGFRFISYAVWWIRQSLIKAIADQSRMIRLPLNKVVLNLRVQKTMLAMEQQLERSPTKEEIAETLQIEPSEVSYILEKNNRHRSLDTPLSDEQDVSLLDTIINTDAPMAHKYVHYNESLKTEINRAFKILMDRQKETLCHYFGIGTERAMSLDDIGAKFNITTERVRQIKDKAINRLRTNRSLQLLQGFLG